jgi:predicted nucleic acid-binding protein
MTEKIVLDSGIAAKWFASEADSAQALSIYDQYQQGFLEFIAPTLIYAEFGNIFWKKQIHQGFNAEDALTAVQEFKNVVLTLTPVIILYDDAFKIAVKNKRTFYDSLYLALSLREGCRFVTADERLYNAVNADLPDVVRLADWK